MYSGHVVKELNRIFIGLFSRESQNDNIKIFLQCLDLRIFYTL